MTQAVALRQFAQSPGSRSTGTRGDVQVKHGPQGFHVCEIPDLDTGGNVGLSTKCYREKYGVAPFPSGLKKGLGKKSSISIRKDKAARNRGNGKDRECEGCKVLGLQLEEIGRVERIMVAAGLVPAEKFDQARKIARELAK